MLNLGTFITLNFFYLFVFLTFIFLFFRSVRPVVVARSTTSDRVRQSEREASQEVKEAYIDL